MALAKIVVVHGINNTYKSRVSMLAEWVPSLLGGVELAVGRNHGVASDDIDAVLYGDLFRPPAKRLGIVPFYRGLFSPQWSRPSGGRV